MTTWSTGEANHRTLRGAGTNTCAPPNSADRLGVPLAPIPGTKRVKWLEQNVAALDITLTADELAVLDPLAAQVTGARGPR